MEKKNNPYVICAVALFVLAFVLTLTSVFHVTFDFSESFFGEKIEMLFPVHFGYSGLEIAGETVGDAVWAEVILIIFNWVGALFLLGYSMNLIPKFPFAKFIPLVCAALCLLFVIIAWIAVPAADEFDDLKVVMSFDGWMLMFTELAACVAAFLATKNDK